MFKHRWKQWNISGITVRICTAREFTQTLTHQVHWTHLGLIERVHSVCLCLCSFVFFIYDFCLFFLSSYCWWVLIIAYNSYDADEQNIDKVTFLVLLIIIINSSHFLFLSYFPSSDLFLIQFDICLSTELATCELFSFLAHRWECRASCIWSLLENLWRSFFNCNCCCQPILDLTLLWNPQKTNEEI